MDTSDSIASMAVPSHGFLYHPTNNVKIVDPNTGKPVTAMALTATIDGNVQVKYKNSATKVVVPLFAGQRRSMQVTEIDSTNTTTGDVIVEY